MKAILLVILLSQSGDARVLLQTEYDSMEICQRNAQEAANHFLGQSTRDSYQIVCAPWSIVIGGNQ